MVSDVFRKLWNNVKENYLYAMIYLYRSAFSTSWCPEAMKSDDIICDHVIVVLNVHRLAREN